ncbi:MAG: UDP-N-acetylglucosamine 2-epimerase (hydrolyzing), partial [Chromatiales bacterium]|nr:UDP-N-acetylglucosamine 2-epimerase (hydrolyzing) [Chromatiales bacterium]
MSRHIVAVTTSRADYGHLYWPLRYLAQKPDICVTLAVTAAHLSPEFGHTADQIAAIDGVTIVEVESLLSSDTDVGMAKTIAVTALGLTELLAQLRP